MKKYLINVFDDSNINNDFKLNIYIDNIFAFNYTASSSFTIKQLKAVLKLYRNIDEINYTISYNKHDITKCDSFSMKEIFLIKTKPHYDIHIKMNENIINVDNSKVIMIPIYGENKVIAYKTKSRIFEEKIPIYNENLINNFVFPFNAKHINIPSKEFNEKMIVTGGTQCNKCFMYSYRHNEIEELPNMKNNRQRHVTIYLNDGRVFIIGGDETKDVECININSKLYQQYPQMIMKRKDPCAIIINNKLLYVLMGYVNDAEGVVSNFERLDITKEPFTCEWELMTIENDIDTKIPRCYSGCYNDENGFLIIGGMYNNTIESSIIKMEINNEGIMIGKRSDYNIDYRCAFCESVFVDVDMKEEEYYLFDFNRNIIKIDPRWKSIEIIKNKIYSNS